MATITAPNPEANDTVAGVQFVDGRAEADLTPSLAHWFRRKGYTVAAAGQPIPGTVEERPDGPDLGTPAAPASSASKAEWEAYVAALGVDTTGLTKAQLIAAAGEAS